MLFAILTACTLPIETSVSEEVETRFQFTDSCLGSESFEDSRGGGLYTLTPVDGGCQLDVVWAGEVVDQAALDAEVEGQLEGRDRSRLSLQAATAMLSDVGLADASGGPIRVSVFPSYDLDLDLGGSDFYDDSGVAASTLLAEPVSIPLTPPQLDVVTAALQGGGTVEGELSATVVVSDEDLSALADLGETQLVFNLDIDLQLGVDIL